MVWASCLRKVQALRQGGSWQRAEGRTATNAASLVRDRDGSTTAEGADAAVAQDQQHVGDQLEEQLDILTSLTYPNSSIRFVTRSGDTAV